MNLEELKEGNISFQKSSFKLYKDDFEALVDKGQTPEVLFIGCSDSRVVPDLIVNSRPGDMFILRNIGNFVPPFKEDNDFHGSAAVIEYAVSILNVKHIIVCGHSHCGACSALYSDLGDSVGLVHVRKWLELGKNAKSEALPYVERSKKPEELFPITEKISITHQLQNLLSYPEVKKRVEENQLKLHGWYYKIEDGTIEEYNQSKKVFEALEAGS